MDNYISVKQAAEDWGISRRRVQNLCKMNRIDGVLRSGRYWVIPENAMKPQDKRRRISEEKTNEI